MVSREDIKTIYKYLYNPISILGFLLLVISTAMFLGLLLIDAASKTSSSYIGIFFFIINPPFFITGLFLIPYGLIKQHKKLHTVGVADRKHMIIDFNLGKHRRNFLLFTFFGFMAIISVTLVSYHSFHYTESVEFCSTCHSVMDPETITHQKSPHAKVSCVECHVGSGADWYVKSKLSGLYQVYSVWFNKYSRPIQTPIHNLRPARDTCEQCHWPQYFIDNKLVVDEYVLPDDENTVGYTSLIMKTGGTKKHSGASGIHWHISAQVNYIARDRKKEDIPWIEVVREDGSREVFQSENNPLTDEELNTLPKSTMDCIDCHNRPSHIFHAPEKIMADLILADKVSPDLPGIRSAGSAVMTAEYTDSDEADREIEKRLKEQYLSEDATPELKEKVTRAIKHIKEAFHENIFPVMKTRWDVHSWNIGHKFNPGCFRCHNGEHSSDQGNTISRDCNLCHTIAAQGIGSRADSTLSLKPMEFIHPEDIGEEWKEVACHECHTGE